MVVQYTILADIAIQYVIIFEGLPKSARAKYCFIDIIIVTTIVLVSVIVIVIIIVIILVTIIVII